MTKRNLAEWAAISDILETAAVVASLIFVEEWWGEVRAWYGDDFARHVDAAYARK